MVRRRRESPLRRTNPSGKRVWVARWTDRHGRRQSAGTFDKQREAQTAIDAAYDAHYNAVAGPEMRVTVGGYAADWLRRHPRADRTARSYGNRVAQVLDVKLSGLPLKDWPMQDVRPREVTDLIDHMLREQKRAATGASVILATLSAMWRDGISDDATHYNPFRDVRVRATDPRVVKAPRKTRIYSWQQMHALAAAAPGVYGEPMIRMLSDCGLRLGEMLALERGDLRPAGCGDEDCPCPEVPHLHVARTAYDGVVEVGTKTTRGRAVEGRVAPVPDGLLVILRGLPARLDTRLLFPAARGGVWQNRYFYKDVWYPARLAVGLPDARPHEFRHAYVSLLRAGGVDPADLAAWTGHTVATATDVYTHSVGATAGLARTIVG